MRRVFGEINIDEEKIIKFTLYIFCSSYMFRVIFDLIAYIYYDEYKSIFSNQPVFFISANLLFWVMWDYFPLVSMLIINYKNFSSFTDSNDILYTEYTYDDVRTTVVQNNEFVFDTGTYDSQPNGMDYSSGP